MKKYYSDTFIDMSFIERVEVIRCEVEIVPNAPTKPWWQNERTTYTHNKIPLPIPDVCIFFTSGSSKTLTGEQAQEFLFDHKEYIRSCE